MACFLFTSAYYYKFTIINMSRTGNTLKSFPKISMVTGFK